MPELTQIQVGLTEETIGRLATIARYLGNDSKANAIKFAARLALSILEADQRGEKILIQCHDGSMDRLFWTRMISK